MFQANAYLTVWAFRVRQFPRSIPAELFSWAGGIPKLGPLCSPVWARVVLGLSTKPPNDRAPFRAKSETEFPPCLRSWSTRQALFHAVRRRDPIRTRTRLPLPSSV